MKRFKSGSRAWLAVLVGVVGVGHAATVEWIGAAGEEGGWTNTANWNGGALPGGGDTARISNGGIAALDSDLSSGVNPALQLSNGSTLRVRDGAATTNMTVSLYESNIEISGGMLHMPYDTVSTLGARGTNRIMMTGGVLSGTVRYANAADVDTTLFLSNGTVVSEHYDAYHGGAGGTATVIQEGGYHGWRLILGGSSGGTGRYFLNEGELYAPYPFIGRNGAGYLEMGPKGRITLGGRNGTESIYLANGDNSAGTVVLNHVTNNLAENGVLRNTFGPLRLYSSTGNSRNASAAIIFNHCQLTLTNAITLNKAHDSRMDLVVNGGLLALCDTQGNLTTFAWPTSGSSNAVATVTITNGASFSAGILNMYSGGKLVNAGGNVTVDPFTFKSYSTNTVVDLLAGSMTVASQIQIGNTRAAEFRMRDGHALQLSEFKDTTGTQTNEFLLTYVLRKKPVWQIPLTFTGTTARRIGHLRVALEGGVLLADTNACVVAETLNSDFWGNQPFTSVPDPNLWLEARSGTKQSIVSLSASGNKGELDMEGVRSASFGPAAMGYVSLSNVDTRRLVDLTIRLHVEPQGETTLADIVAGFVSAGYTNSVAVTGDDGCNMTLAIPAAAVYDTKGPASESYFVWDFTRTAIQSIDATTTNALVSQVCVAYTKLPPEGTLIRVQ